jgi:molybdopterin-guanine dinucleotide biosynthesis protein A
MRIASCLLAGGRSRRLGRDKRFLPFRGKPLIVRAYEAAAALTDEIWVLIANVRDKPTVREALGKRPVHFAVDPEPQAGPLGALAGALEQIQSEYALLLAVDYPLITGPFLQQLKASLLDAQAVGPDVLVPVWQGMPQVACAFYHRSLRDELHRAFQQGERSLRRFVESLPAERVQEVTEAIWGAWTKEDVFLNLNTAEDLQRLRALETQTTNLR